MGTTGDAGFRRVISGSAGGKAGGSPAPTSYPTGASGPRGKITPLQSGPAADRMSGPIAINPGPPQGAIAMNRRTALTALATPLALGATTPSALAGPQLAHMVFFTLENRNAEGREKLA